MQIRIRFPLRHPFFPEWAATPTRLAKGACTTLSGSFAELMRAATSVRPSRAVFVMHYPESIFLTDRERDTLWEVYQVPVFALLLDGEGRLVGWECEAHDGLHIGSSCPESADDQLIFSSEDSVLGYRLPLDRFVIESAPCQCGRPGQRLQYAPRRAGKPMQVSTAPLAERREIRVG
ncbi:MAG TPA: hypothetical protein VKU19_09290 [Bryobacteraceae bacterium]|nr:hypothetical protein [Bryobacteraceae bacterium]